MTLKEAYDLYLKWCARHSTQSTVDTRRQRLAKFMRWNNLGCQPVESIDCATINDWTEYSQKHLKMTGNVGPLIRNQILIFFRWAELKKIVPVNPLDIRLLTKLFPQQVQRPAFTWEQHQSILRYLQQHQQPFWADACVLGWHTGMRCSDIVNLLWSDIDFDQQIINRQAIKTKRFGKSFCVPMDKEVIQVLDRLRDLSAASSPCVFPGQQCIWSLASQRTMLPNQFRRILDGCEVGPRYSFHSYRHAFISRLFNAGVDAKIIQTMTGQSLTVLYSYVTVTLEIQRRALDRARPAEEVASRWSSEADPAGAAAERSKPADTADALATGNTHPAGSATEVSTANQAAA